MKIVHLASGNLNSGAGLGARWLHRALFQRGVDTHLYTSRSPSGHLTNEYLVPGYNEFYLKILTRVDKFPLFIRNLKPTRNFSCGFSGINLKRLVARTNADILHLHFVNLGLLRINSIKSAGVPIVWTFRDMWPFTGGCHYSWKCSKYENACGNCPILSSKKYHDYTYYSSKLKTTLYKDIPHFYPVAISPWLQRCANNSSPFKDSKVKMIWNGVDLENFKKLCKSSARNKLNFRQDKPLILLGASNASSVLKGYDKYLEELSKLEEISQYQVVRFGIFDKHDHPYKWLIDVGFLKDRSMLNLLYSAADVFVAPSPQEAFGKTIVESLASGTPAVVFDESGSSEIIQHGISGEVVQNGNYREFAQRSLDLAFQTFHNDNIRDLAVERSLLFSDKICAQHYHCLYDTILKF